MIKMLSKTFNVGEVALIRISDDKKIIGYFTLIFKQGNEIKNTELVELYSNYVGLFLDRNEFINRIEIKERLLIAIANSTDELLKNSDYYKAAEIIFNLLGTVTDVDRVYLFENKFDMDGNPLNIFSQKIEWCSEFAKPQIDNIELQDIPYLTLADCSEPMSGGNAYSAIVSQLPEGNFKSHLLPQKIKSLLVFPLFVENKFWGFVGFDECKYERVWSTDEFSILQTFAGSFSYAIERKILINKLNDSILNAENATKAKGEFLANMSHEIRTPLNGVIGFSDLLMRTELSVLQNQYAKSINQSASTLLDLINDILDFSKIEAGKLVLNIEKVDIRDLAEQITDIVKFSAHKKDLEILLNLKSNVPLFVFADYVRIRQVLVNLMSNAIKFTEKGEIEIKVEYTELEKTGRGIIKFSIRDTGIGIQEDQQLKILDSFTQADLSITKKFGGSGLGLTIVTKLLALMGSKLSIESEKGKGSIFSFELELETCDEVFDQGNDNSYLQSFKKVLIVDDNQNNLIIVNEMLKLLHISSDMANNAFDAINLVKHEKYNLAIIDFNMPGKDGLTLIDEIRNTLKISYNKLPIIILHSSSELDNISFLIESKKINLEMVKPLKLSQLVSGLQKVSAIDIEENETEIIVEENLDQNLPITQEAKPSLKIMIVEDNLTNLMLAKHILNVVCPDVTIIEAMDGKEAVDTFEKELPDLILMDINMPVMSGYDATKLIRKTANGKDVPIVALTAGTLNDEKIKSIESGMNDYISKPIVIETLELILEKYICFKKT